MHSNKINHFVAAIFAICLSASAATHAQQVQVALLDSGVDDDIGLNLAPGFNYILNNNDTSDVSTREGETHGNISAQLIAQSFNGQIVPFVVVNNDGINSIAQRTAAREQALSDILGRTAVRVVSISRGGPGISGSASSLIPQLSNANKVVAIMAGNRGKAQPTVLATSSFNLSGVIIVGASDASGNILSFSNRAGTTANKYVVANGAPPDNFDQGGSSWAAARISGIAGAVFQQNPNLTAAEVVEVILKSAEDRGAIGTDTEYGRGFIRNAQQVLSNVIGPPTVPVEPEGGGGAGAALLLGGAVAGAVLYARSRSKKLEKTLVLDSYGRGFQADLSKQIQVHDDTLYLNDFFNSLEQQSFSETAFFPRMKTRLAFNAVKQKTVDMDLIEYFSLPGDVAFQDKQADFSLAMTSQLSPQVELFAGHKVDANYVYGGAAHALPSGYFGTSSFISGHAFGSVLSGFNQQADTVSVNYRPETSKYHASLGFISSDDDTRFGLKSTSSIVQGGYQFSPRVGVNMQIGMLDEKGSVLGGASEGIFSANRSQTQAVNFSGHIKIRDGLTFLANYGIGRTRVKSSKDSLFKDFSHLKSDWYSVGLVANNLFRGRDQFGVSYSQPLKITSGSVNFSIPTHYRADGLINFDTERVRLSDSNATQTNVELYYRTVLAERVELGGYFTYRNNPNHTRENGDDAIIMSTLRFY